MCSFVVLLLHFKFVYRNGHISYHLFVCRLFVCLFVLFLLFVVARRHESEYEEGAAEGTEVKMFSQSVLSIIISITVVVT